MPEELPIGWVRTTLGQIAEPSRVRAMPSEDPEIPYVGLEHVESQTMRLIGHGHAYDVRSSSVRFAGGDVLYARMRPYLNKVWIAEFDGLCSGEFLVFAKNQFVNAEFLANMLNSEEFVSFANGQVSGERPRVDFEKLARFPILLPPLAEQGRIVAKFKAALAGVEGAATATRRAKGRLKQYRAAVLRAAITGELTHNWRESTPTGNSKGRVVLQNPSPPLGDLPKLPEGWSWTTVQHVGEVRLGRQRSPKDHTGKHMRPYLRVANVFEDRIDTSDVMRMNFTPEEFEAYRLNEGDILLNEGQSLELVGRPAMYRNEVPGCCFQNTLVRFRVTELVDARYALIVFRSYLHNGQFQRIAKITTNLAHLGAERFSELEFPIPPLSEQLEIVRLVERRLSAAERLSVTLDEQLVRARKTRQSLRSQAFRGQLASQDSEDEPASILLKRIQLARADEAQKTKGTHMTKSRSRVQKTRRPLLDVLREQQKPITPEELFRAAAFEPSQVDQFYRELASLRDKLIEQKPHAAEARLWPHRAKVSIRLKKGAHE
jgi:type I restriction enzyme, S subunit